MKEEFFTIGQVFNLTDIPESTLRYYDRKNLLKPSFRNPETGYRYYMAEDINKLKFIKAIREMDVAIEEIRELMNENKTEKIEQLIMKQIVISKQRLEEAQKNISDMENFLSKLRKMSDSSAEGIDYCLLSHLKD